MADSTVAALPDGSPAQPTDYIYAVRSPYTSGTDYRLSLSDVINLVLSDLSSAVVLKGSWDASAGTFPGSGNALAGWSYIVTVAGTVDSVAFSVGDRIIAIADSASTTTYASNWLKLDYTDAVLSVDGSTGAVDLSGTYQPLSATLTSLAGASANGVSLVTAANYAAMRTLLDLEAGTDFYSISAADAAFQPLDADLTAIAALANTDGNIIVGNGSAWVAESGATARTSLGLGTGDSPEFTNLLLTGYHDFTEISAPSAPGAGVSRVWAEDNNGISVLHWKSDLGVDHQLGRDLLAVVRNDTGSTLTTGQVVYISGSNGTTPQVALARSDSASTMPALGVVVADISTNGFGQVCFAGDVRGLNTSGWTAGDVLYVDPSTAGALTNTPPSGANIPQRVGVVVTSNPSQGIINVIIGAELDPALTQTLTNKTISLTSNTISGTMAEFDAAASDGNFVWDSDVGVSVQAYDAGLASIAGLTTAADRMIYTTASDTYAVATLTGFARSILDDVDEATFKATVNLEIGTDVQAHSSVLDNTTASFTTAQETKLGHISVTQAVDLDAIETRVNALDAAVVLMGAWDASVGTFPGGGTAQAGESWIVSVGGTVDSVVFTANDRIVAIADNASTTTYASNWHKLDYTDAVLSVDGSTGAVDLSSTYQPLDADLTSWAGVTRAAGFDTFAATPSSANLAALVTGETGSGALVFATSPTLVTPALGTPSSATLTNATGLPIVGGTTGTLSVARGGTGRTTSTTAYGLLAAGTTATGAHQTLAAGATTEILVGGGASALPVWTTATGSGAPVRATSPTLVTPALGTPTALVGTNITGTGASFTAGAATAANGLKTATTTIAISSATAPSSGQVLRATSSTAATWQTSREVLTGNRTYYVNGSTGSDSNDGLSSGAPFLTIQKAVDVALSLDFSIYWVTISIASGTYTAGASISSPIVGVGPLYIEGDTTTPSNVTISTTGACITVDNGATVQCAGLKLVSSGSWGTFVQNGSTLVWYDIFEMGACSAGHMYFNNFSYGSIESVNYTISGNAAYHQFVGFASKVRHVVSTVTLSGTPAFSAAYVNAGGGYANLYSNTYSGSATGTRYSANENGIINTYGAGATYLPGNASGSTATQGQYF